MGPEQRQTTLSSFGCRIRIRTRSEGASLSDSKGVDAGLLQTRYRLTKQRAAILRALQDGSHLTAEAIHERVRAELPAVSLGTIYRTLDILRGIGLVQTFTIGGAARYEAALDKHHHLVCLSCSEIINVPIPEVGALALAVGQDHRYTALDAALVVTGRCSRCAGLARNGSS
jgi:Fur family ferric uptake transcriptional regulator